jgi:hypothetical protein
VGLVISGWNHISGRHQEPHRPQRERVRRRAPEPPCIRLRRRSTRASSSTTAAPTSTATTTLSTPVRMNVYKEGAAPRGPRRPSQRSAVVAGRLSTSRTRTRTRSQPSPFDHPSLKRLLTNQTSTSPTTNTNARALLCIGHCPSGLGSTLTPVLVPMRDFDSPSFRPGTWLFSEDNIRAF